MNKLIRSLLIFCFSASSMGLMAQNEEKKTDSKAKNSNENQAAFFQKYFDSFALDSLKSGKGLGLNHFHKGLELNIEEARSKQLDYNMPVFKPEGEHNMPIQKPKGHYTMPIYGTGSINTDGFTVQNPLDNTKSIQEKKVP
ncbi:hypothetical protein [Flagellimonas sp.]|uniref:hypothetical protein n=1 Tax=Flagellimonas sp. TaxID=2058762 RepID=UPI003B5A4E9D